MYEIYRHIPLSMWSSTGSGRYQRTEEKFVVSTGRSIILNMIKQEQGTGTGNVCKN